MSARRRVLTAILLAATLAPRAASAQHGTAPPVKHEAAPPAPGTAEAIPPAHEGSAPAKPAAAKVPDASSRRAELRAALLRIDQKIAEGRKTAAPPRAAGTVPPRVRLSWRLGLTWPSEIGGSGDEPVAEGNQRVALTWR